jgi:hypothetical protein
MPCTAARWWKFVAIKSASIEGLDELIEAFMKLPEESIKYLKAGADEAGNVVLAKTKEKEINI